MAEVRPVASDELSAVSALVGRVFASDPMLTWTFPPQAEPEAAAERFFATFHRAAFGDGWIWVVGHGSVEGMAMWVPPDPTDRYGQVMTTVDPEVTALMGERKARYDGFWAWIDEHRPAEPHWYLEHIAVDADRRGAGLGRSLIEHGLSRADADRAPAWLVTSKSSNVPMYEHFGFWVASDEDAPEGGPHLWFMRRDPMVSDLPT